MKTEYVVQFRQGTGVDLATLSAYRVEGWAHDFAFFGNANDLRSPTDLIPREVVLRIWEQAPVPHGDGVMFEALMGEKQA